MKDFFSINQNDQISNLHGLDLQELLIQIENFKLEYRENLALSKNVSFGIEIEYENVFRFLVNSYIKKNFSDWIGHKDASLDNGGEITSPILYDNEKTWNDLKNICNYLKKKKANTLNRAGGHIHIGSQILEYNLNYWRLFIKMYMLYENVIFRFAYGEKLQARRTLQKFAPPIANSLFEKIEQLNRVKTLSSLSEVLPVEEKYQALNFRNTIFLDVEIFNKNTVEFRSPNATIEEIVWQNNINAFTKLMLAATKGLIDEECLDYKISNFTNYDFMYKEICLKSVLEFVDLIFDNNLDKIYFLKQYFKDFKDISQFNSLKRTRKFNR